MVSHWSQGKGSIFSVDLPLTCDLGAKGGELQASSSYTGGLVGGEIVDLVVNDWFLERTAPFSWPYSSFFNFNTDRSLFH